MRSNAEVVEVLLVSGESATEDWIAGLLADRVGFRCALVRAAGGSEAVEHLAVGAAAAVLVDRAPRGCTQPEVIRRLVASAPGVPVLGLIDADGRTSVADVARAGAQACLLRDRLDGAQLEHALRFALERTGSEKERVGNDAIAGQGRTVGDPAGRASLLSVDGRVLRAGRSLCRLLGCTEAEAVGLTWEDLTHPADLPGVRDGMRRLFDGAAPAFSSEYRCLHRRGRVVWARTRATLVRSVQGEPLYVVLRVRDVTRRRRTEDGGRFLAEVAAGLASSLDFGESLRRVVQFAVPGLADWCTISLRHGDRLRLVELAAADPARQSLLDEWRSRFPTSGGTLRHPGWRVLLSGRPSLWRRARGRIVEQMAEDPEHVRILEQLDTVSTMILPLHGRGRVLGTITLGASTPGRHYGLRDLVSAEEFARHAGLAIENALLFRDLAGAAAAHREPPGAPPYERRPTGSVPLPATYTVGADETSTGESDRPDVPEAAPRAGGESTGPYVAIRGNAVPSPRPGVLPAPERAVPAWGGTDPLRMINVQERRVLSLAAMGFTAAEIGVKLFLSPKTVETYRSRAMRKVGLNTRAELVAFAMRVGLLSLDGSQAPIHGGLAADTEPARIVSVHRDSGRPK